MGVKMPSVFRAEQGGLTYQVIILLAVAMAALSGCGPDYSGQIVDLQKQISLLSRQIEDMRKELTMLRDSGATMRQALNDAEAEINRLKTLETLPTGGPKGSLQEEDIVSTPVPMSIHSAKQKASQQKPLATTEQTRTVPIACSQVWALLGKGKGAKEVAKILATSIEQVHSCEQKIGRGASR